VKSTRSSPLVVQNVANIPAIESIRVIEWFRYMIFWLRVHGDGAGPRRDQCDTRKPSGQLTSRCTADGSVSSRCFGGAGFTAVAYVKHSGTSGWHRSCSTYHIQTDRTHTIVIRTKTIHITFASLENLSRAPDWRDVAVVSIRHLEPRLPLGPAHRGSAILGSKHNKHNSRLLQRRSAKFRTQNI
jgi:hypothetical protein